MIKILDFFPTENDFPEEKYKQEVWADITDNEIKDVVPNRYMVSTWGRVYDKYNGNYYPTENVNSTSYPSVHIRFIDGSYKTIKIHHIMMRRFRPIDYNPSVCTDVDHKDGVMYHNWIWNLERVTHQENIKRCVNIGLYPVGEQNPHSILSNNQVRLICKLISDGYRTSDIVKMLSNDIPCISKHIVNDIKSRRNYASISSEFNFDKMYYNNYRNNMLDDSILHGICKCLEIDRNMKPKDIAEILGLDLGETKSEFYNRFYQSVARLKTKQIHKRIWENYNY